MKILLLTPLILLFACSGAMRNMKSPPKSLLKAERSYLSAGNINTSEELLLATIAKDQRRPDAHYLLAELLDVTGRPAEALPHYLKTLNQSHLFGDTPNEAIASAMAVVAIRDRIEGFKGLVSPLLKTVSNDPGQLPPEAIFQLRNIWFAFALKEGDQNKSNLRRSGLGCLNSWDTVGPFGPRTWSTFDAGPAPLGISNISDPWPNNVDLGPGAGISKIISAVNQTCAIKTVDPVFSNPGVTWARTWLTLTQREAVLFRLDTGSSVRVYAGELEIFSKDNRTERSPSTNWFSASIPAGTTQISVQAANPNSPPAFSLVAITEDGRALQHTNNHRSSPSADGLPLELKKITPRNGGALLAALRAAIWHDSLPLAQKLISIINDRYGSASPMIMAIAAEVVNIDPGIPSDIAFERSSTLLKKALVIEPTLWEARLAVARTESMEGRDLDALKIITKGLELSPAEPSLLVRLISLTAGLNWIKETQAALTRLEGLIPLSCDALSWRLELARRSQRFDLAINIAAKILKCDARSPAMAEELGRAQRYKEQEGALKLRAGLLPNEIGPLNDLATNAAVTGDIQTLIKMLRAMLQLDPSSPEIIKTLADALIASGNATRAIVEVKNAILSLPGPQPVLEDLLFFLKRERPFEEHRLDGPSIIRDYQKNADKYDTSAVWVLDRVIHLIARNGSRTELVHNIVHLNSDEAVEKHGELTIPGDAHLLKSRTIKPDGRILEPENIPGKSTVSLPNLETGDFIEVEYIVHHESSPIFPGGFDTGRFYFADFNTGFHRSEMIVVHPSTIKIQMDPRGDCPAPITREESGMKVSVWRVRRNLPQNLEPKSPVATEYLPSIRVTAYASMKNLCSRIDDLLTDQRLSTLAVGKILTEIKASTQKTNPKALGRSIYHWVMENIEEDGDLFSQAGHIIASRSGSRVRAFRALLTEARIDSRFAFVKSIFEDSTKTPIPSINILQHIAVLVGNKTWVSFDQDQSPYGYMPPSLRDQPVIFLDKCEPSISGKGVLPVDKHDIQLSIIVSSDGKATAEVTETLEGSLAANWRTNLKAISSEKREQRFQEDYLSKEISGAHLEKIEFQMLESPDSPLVLNYSFSAPNMIRDNGNTISLTLPFKTSLSKHTGGLPSRKTPLILKAHLEKTFMINISTPPGTRIKKLPPMLVGSAWGSLERRFKGKTNKASVNIQINLNADRVSPVEYLAFMAFALQIDLASTVEIIYEK